MHRRTTRTNRWLLGLVGLILFAGGGYLIVRSEGWIPGQSRFAKLYTPGQVRWMNTHHWIWIAVAAVVVVLGLLALRWLVLQPRVDRLHSVRIEPDGAQHGRTTLPADALTDAVEDDVAEFPGVAGVRAVLIGAVDDPELLLRVSAKPESDVAEIHRHIVDEALPAARAALDSERVPAQVHLYVSGRKRAQRVVR